MSIEYNRRAVPPVVIVTADDGTVRAWPLAEFDADPSACVAATGNGIRAPVPDKISAAQAMTALAGAGLLDAAQALIDAPETPVAVKIFWNREHEFNRESPALNQMAGLLGLDSDALDDLFRAAAQIAV